VYIAVNKVAGCKSRTKYSRLFAERKIQNSIPAEPLADFEAYLTIIKHKYHLLETSASHSLVAYQRKRLVDRHVQHVHVHKQVHSQRRNYSGKFNKYNNAHSREFI
jgi:hypothetical protein